MRRFYVIEDLLEMKEVNEKSKVWRELLRRRINESYWGEGKKIRQLRGNES